MQIVINPGSGPVKDCGRGVSEKNIVAFIKDLGQKFPDKPDLAYKFKGAQDDGRHTYVVFDVFEEHEVDMPAIPLESVRFIDAETQNIFDFPRLYVDGSSWVWKFALNVFYDEK